jgi:hypothetical protein
MKNVAILGPKSDEDVWNIPISFLNHFKKMDYNVKFYNTLVKGNFDDTNLNELIWEYKQSIFVPDLILHLDFGLFNSPLLNKSSIPTAKWVVESGDDPQNFNLNYVKVRAGNFDLVLSPDVRCVTKYQQMNINAAWFPHFADPDQFEVEQDPIYDSVTTRSVAEPFFKSLKEKLGDSFEPRMEGFFHGKEHSIHLKKGKIVVQNSKYKEITRRVFEGMMSNRLVITDRPDPETQIDCIFTENEHLIYFDDLDDCVAKIKYYASNDELRKIIAQKGYEKVKKFHTTPARIQKLLTFI